MSLIYYESIGVVVGHCVRDVGVSAVVYKSCEYDVELL